MNLEEIRENLIKEKTAIEEVIKSLSEESKEVLRETVTASDEEADRYEFKEDLHFKIETLEARLARINKALEKIFKGTYGFCEKCGKKIDDQRLRIDLAAEVCRECLKL